MKADAGMLPKLLVIAATFPGDSGVGPLLLRDLCRLYARERLAISVVCPLAKSQKHPEFAALSSLYVDWPYDFFSRGSQSAAVSALWRHARFRAASWRHDRHLMSQLLAFAARVEPDLICTVLNSPTIFRVAPRLAKRLRLPMISIVWDPPEGIGLHCGMDRFSRKASHRHFTEALEASVRCGVISDSMREEYRREFGTESVVLRQGVCGSLPSADPPALDATSMRIGFAGSMYAQREWQALLAALNRCQWIIAGRPVTLEFLGSDMPAVRVKSPARIEFFGWRSMEEAIARLARCDFNYLPYWFHPAYADSVRLCFATKLTTYLAAGRPVFYHGPKDADIIRFSQRYPIVLGCHSLEPEDIAEKLERLALDRELQNELMSGGRRAVQEELNPSVFAERFANLLGVPVSALTGLQEAPEAFHGSSGG